MACDRAELAHPVHHRFLRACQQVEAPRAFRATQHRAFNAQRMQGRPPGQAIFNDLQGLLATGQRQRGMPQQMETELAQLRRKVCRVCAQQRHTAAPAAAGL